MGCWNETCAISKLAINYGEPVRFLVIAQNAFSVENARFGGYWQPISPGKSGCYISDLWTPLCFPIRGNYNDYGSIDPTGSAEELNQFVSLIKDTCILPDPVGNDIEEVEEDLDVPLTNIKDATPDEIFEYLQDGRLFINYHSALPQYSDRVVPVGWMMIKETVWQSLLKIDHLKGDERWIFESKIEDGKPDTWTLGGIKSTLKQMMVNAKKTDYLSKYYYRFRAFDHSPYDGPQLDEHNIDAMAELEIVHQSMQFLRINYAPTCGSGSQSHNIKLWASLYAQWSEIVDKEIKDRAAEETLDDDES